MEKMPLNLFDLVPKEVTFKLASYPDKDFKLCRWSLRVRSWATEKYGEGRLREIFERQEIEAIADMTWFMLKDEDKKFFNDSKVDFLDAISTMQDQVNVIKGLLGSVGIGEPEIQKISEAQFAAGVKDKSAEGTKPDPKSKAPKKK